MNTIQNIKQQISVNDVMVHFGLQPDKYGFVRSPINPDKHPSLKLYKDTNTFKDYSSGKQGDVINLYSLYKGVDNKTAVLDLAEMCHNKTDFKPRFSIKKPVFKDENQENHDKQITAEILNECKNRPLAWEHRTYLNNRGISNESIEHFGFFTFTYQLFNELKSKYKDKINTSGLVNKNLNFMFMNHELIIPYYEYDEAAKTNNIVYLRGRCILENAWSKYTGSYGHSSRRFYNHNALTNYKNNFDNDLYICEGEFDTVIMHQNGYRAVGVPGVGNFPHNSVQLLKRFDINIIFDNDEPGIKAANKTAEVIYSAINKIPIIKQLPENIKDISDYYLTLNKNV